MNETFINWVPVGAREPVNQVAPGLGIPVMCLCWDSDNTKIYEAFYVPQLQCFVKEGEADVKLTPTFFCDDFNLPTIKADGQV